MSIDLITELRYARKIIRQMKRETNEHDAGRKLAIRADKRLTASLLQHAKELEKARSLKS